MYLQLYFLSIKLKNMKIIITALVLFLILPRLYAQDTSFVFDYKMIPVEGGCFEMGFKEEREGEGHFNNLMYDNALHRVCVSDFYIGETEVTQAQWEVIMGESPSEFENCPDCPVESVSYNRIQDFLKALNAKTPYGYYRLPTEAEWEFAARGGLLSKNYIFAGGNKLEELGEHWWNNSISTRPVKGKDPNELGLYDMTGNVKEWCWDAMASYAPGTQQNPLVMGQASSFRCLRGGSWGDFYESCRLAYRDFTTPLDSSMDIGFRLVFSLSSEDIEQQNK